ncbi:MAG: glycine zipper 2TM domain-containing protein [Rhodospirillales bacterium]|nr:MAG: glycine zipper 2TM domain-containing protein [Rhodospirillales bacterium]
MARQITAVSVVAGVLVACTDMGPKETTGTLVGAGAGAVVGGQVGGGEGRLVGVAVGTLLGALLGGEIGRSLDRADQVAAQQAYERAQSAPINKTITWQNPDNGHYGSVTPVREGTSSEGEYCREFQQTVTIGGRQERAYGVACQQPDGSWQIVQ